MNDIFGIDQSVCVAVGRNPVGVDNHVVMIPKVARGRATLGWRMEARWANRTD